MKNLFPRVRFIFSWLMWHQSPDMGSSCMYFSDRPKSTKLTLEFSFTLTDALAPLLPGVGTTEKRSAQSEYVSSTTLLGFTSECKNPTSWSLLRLSIYTPINVKISVYYKLDCYWDNGCEWKSKVPLSTVWGFALLELPKDLQGVLAK